jgi:hypothetical protein
MAYEKIAKLRDFLSVIDIMQVNLLANKDKKIYKDSLDVYELTQALYHKLIGNSDDDELNEMLTTLY